MADKLYWKIVKLCLSLFLIFLTQLSLYCLEHGISTIFILFSLSVHRNVLIRSHGTITVAVHKIAS